MLKNLLRDQNKNSLSNYSRYASVFVVCVVLGFMIAMQIRLAIGQRTTLSYLRTEELSARLLQSEHEKDVLQEKIQELLQAKSPAAQKEIIYQHEDNVQLLREQAGLTALEGEGVIVTLDDSKKNIKAGENQNLYVIHDDDLLKVVNELRAAGAEALSINHQRLTATSEIRCAGPTLSVNNVRSAPPYEIRAIGNSKTLENALRMRGGVVDSLRVWEIELKIEVKKKIFIPALKEMRPFEYAAPSQLTEETFNKENKSS